MKHIHVLNIGYPKCGTTWLWNALVANNSVANHPIKENYSLTTGTPVSDYCNQYTADITANFCTANIVLDRYVIKQLAQRPQIKASIILREPKQLLWSTYTFTEITDIDFVGWCYRMCDSKFFINAAQIIDRWQTDFGDRFKIFLYDELKHDNKQFYLNYCKQMGLSPGQAQMPNKTNVTRYKNEMPEIDQDLENLLKLQFEKLIGYK